MNYWWGDLQIFSNINLKNPNMIYILQKYLLNKCIGIIKSGVYEIQKHSYFTTTLIII